MQFTDDKMALELIFWSEWDAQHNTTQHNTTQHNTTQHNLDYLSQGLFVKLFLKSSLIFKGLVGSFSVVKGGVSFD